MPLGASGEQGGPGPSAPGSRGRVTPSPAAAAAAASDSVPAPRVAQVLGYAGERSPSPYACACIKTWNASLRHWQPLAAPP